MCVLKTLLWALLLVSPVAVKAQSTYGSISGAVSDTSGASIAGAQVTLTNAGTAEKRVQTTGNDGLYLFTNLLPGRYSLTVEKTSFKRYTRPEIVVEVNQSAHIDAAMQVGEVSQTVEVTAQTPLLQPESSSLGQVVESRAANELPLNGRNIFNLTAVSPSVVPQGNTTGTVVGKNPFDFANYQIGGSFANQGAFYLDGQPLNIGYINLPLVVPSTDSVQEFKVQYNNLGPEWGKFSGGVINLSTKSGTNEWHGALFEYIRNKNLNANEFFLKTSQLQNGQKNSPPPFTQNQFGGTVSGAAIKNKTFFFGSYEGFRLRQGTVFTTTVPTTAARTGDFSGAGLPVLYDPLTVDPNCPATSNCSRSSFATEYGNGNRIPATRINPTANYLLSLIPNPTGSGVTNNFTSAASTGGNTDQYVARVDQNLSEKQQIFGRYTQYKLLSLAQDPFGTGLCKDRCEEDTQSKALSLGYTYAITPSTTFSFNLSGSRFIYLRGPKNQGFDFTKEGWPAAYNGSVPSLEKTPLTPCFAINDGNVSCSQGQSAIADYDTQINFSPTMTMIRGKHTFVFGGQLEESYDNYLQTNTGGGLISFNGSWTQSLARNASGAVGGMDFADFLLGYGLGAGASFGNQTTGSLTISGPVAGKQTYRAFYFADNYHITKKLLLNLGVRYELQGPWSERHDRLTYFNPGVTNASVTGCSGTAGSSCPGDLFLTGTGVNGSRNSLPLPKHEWSPRLGMAYSLNDKTVLRGGFGLFYIPNFVSFGTNPYIDVVASATSPFIASLNQGLTPASTLNASGCTLSAVGPGNFNCATAGPFGPSLVNPPGRNAQPNISQYGLQQVSLAATSYTTQKPGYVEQWNIDVQRQLPAGFFVDIAYAGAHGVNLEQFSTNVNQIPDSAIAQAQQQFSAGQPVGIAQTVSGYPFNLALPGGLGKGSLIQGQLLRPYPQFGALLLNGQNCCRSNYNSLQLTVRKRFSSGGNLLVAYTNAKLQSNTDTLTSWLESPSGGVGAIQDWNNLDNGEYSLSSQNVSQRLVLSYVVDLPFGKGKRYLSNLNEFANKVVGGWGFDGITTFQTGFPLKVSYGGGTQLSALGLGIGSLRPNVVSGCDGSVAGSHTDRLKEWFNTACFSAPVAYGFGNEPRVDPNLRMQGIGNYDLSVFKRVMFGPEDKIGLEFRTEFFNLFNHVQFGPANTTVVSPTFGVVNSTVNNPRLVQFGLRLAF
jgi:hypothetical protein